MVLWVPVYVKLTSPSVPVNGTDTSINLSFIRLSYTKY